ncbi:helix-turn-helix domain-containing protein [Sphingobacterium faecium]|jgi:AraC-like DNA-binding protein|uniref:helix-turn-helix domain-containing protein n=1 Tax=Sphingobacterium faecium TaxID=34087 RepID=UPI0021B5C412|nr:helix-turn-helix domain-containing protein [Sphingobacterium faecium]UXD70450.1 helix-turn-helix domain-containing protein [Sphingobacterium faecium]WGQ14022.1 helix-turn-helix domain-containing protein [Sphingobacterium faecium]
MPIKLLNRIKKNELSQRQYSLNDSLLSKNCSNKYILGTYVFPCKDLEKNQPLFNDGIPSLIFMPSLSNETILRKKGDLIKLKSVWLCCGIIKDMQWEIPDGLAYIIVIRFNPASFYSIFNINSTALTNNTVCSFEDVVDTKWSSIIKEMYTKNNIEDKLHVWNSALEQLKINDFLPHILKSSITVIDTYKGNLTVSQLVMLLGENVNQKWLQRNFLRYLGITPKKYISLQRFIYTYEMYEREMPTPLNMAPFEGGYYDYNHFFKDFKQYLGVSPKHYSWN